jgi:hypothetical protein
MPLVDVFRKLVLEDPEVSAHAREGVRLAPDFERVFFAGQCFPNGVKEWPVNSTRWTTIGYVHPDPEKRDEFYDIGPVSPIEIVNAAEALLHRYRSLIGMLSSGEIRAIGLSESSGAVERIPSAVWSHENFHINDRGDVLQDNDKCEGTYDRLIRRWVAVELQMTEPMPFHVNPIAYDETPSVPIGAAIKTRGRRSPRAEAVADALKRAGFQKRPSGLTNKQIGLKILPLLADDHLSPEALSKAIARHFKD